MPYLYENLGPERFQKFCQALLVSDYPDLQSFPVAQPDGGRDAVSRRSRGTLGETVAQVKFKRTNEEETAQWMIDALEGELPKIFSLIEQGVTRYIMMTNAKSTAHHGGGSIDLVQKWLDDNIPIESFCLWRDDLDARVDNASSRLKLAYPDLLTGQDALTLMIQAQLGPDRERISRSLRAFVAEQYRRDEQVKFRQVSLVNSLLGLFVDVPVDVSPVLFGDRHRGVTSDVVELLQNIAEPNDEYPELHHGYVAARLRRSDEFAYPKFELGAADLLLDSRVQAGAPWMILHGGPGQGKSTLAQYVCQIHRATYLGKLDFLNLANPAHVGSAFRLPVKVDLRDFANYLDSRPFLGRDEPGAAPRTLERFLSLLVHTQSGGLEFSADDLSGTFAVTPVLLFLDGLDEVADQGLRHSLIGHVLEGLNRLTENGADLQVVITTRPSVFGSNPLLTKSRFLQLDLAPIGLGTINEYADKWVLARGIDAEEGAEVKTILGDKLTLNHIRELTRNPMQLAILLSLIHSVGYSLPDVRTDLYRQYVDLFLTREAEKSPVVRDHRQLLMEIVQYVAWTLQCEAESANSSGSIGREELRLLIAEFLESRQQPTEILDDLFAGGLERVYVLVQRIEGLYEFEVQPLREYFAARFLYSTAPVGTFRHLAPRGDRAQRFEALAANPYWSNVTRFYAGSYESGELGALVSSLKQLIRSPNISQAIAARGIGASLLTDWVFRANKFVQGEVIDEVFDKTGVILASLSLLSGFESASLDPECGRDRVAALLFDGYFLPPGATVYGLLCRLLRRNGGPDLKNRFVTWVMESTGAERTRRVVIALDCGIGANLVADELETLLLSDSAADVELRERFATLVSEPQSLVAVTPKIEQLAIQALLDWGGIYMSTPHSSIALFASILAGDDPSASRIRSVIEGANLPSNRPKIAPARQDLETVLEAIRQIPDSASSPNGAETEELRSSSIIEAARKVFGDRWALFRAAIDQSAFVDLNKNATVNFDLLDPDIPLMTRAAYARRWRGRVSWWSAQLRDDATGAEQVFWAGLLLSWAPSKYIAANLVQLDRILQQMSTDDFQRLREVLDQSARTRVNLPGRLRAGVSVPAGLSIRLSLVLLIAFGKSEIERIPSEYQGDEQIAEIVTSAKLEEITSGFPGWDGMSDKVADEWREVFARVMEANAPIGSAAYGELIRSVHVSTSVAEQILTDPRRYPQPVVNSAFIATMNGYKPEPLRDAAIREDWSFE